LVSQFGKEGGRSGAVWQGPQRAQRLFCAARQPGNHVVGIHTNSLELRDELAYYLRVGHPTPV
jgi:hypothetical protein